MQVVISGAVIYAVMGMRPVLVNYICLLFVVNAAAAQAATADNECSPTDTAAAAAR
jgi:hypothetical protein